MRTFLAALPLLLFAHVSAAQHAVADARQNTDIPAQRLESALEQFARERSLQLVYATDEVRSLRSGEAKGNLSADEALARILQGTGLSHRFLDDKTVTVQPARRNSSTPTQAVPSQQGAQAANEPGGVTQQLRLAQSTATESGSGDAKIRPESGEPADGVPEILVQGSRALNADIRRSENSPQPYVVFDAQEIARSQAVNLEQFLKNRLPMNTAQTNNNQSASAFFGNQSSVNLRGLGTNQTLILIDGRRAASVSVSGTLQQTDINGIALGAIERIEVLPSTASGIYGGGATGGVVNIVTRQDYTGMEMRATYGNAFDTDNAMRRLDLSAGMDLGATHLGIAASHSDSNPLLVGDRDFAARSRALQFANNPGYFNNTAIPPIGRTGNIRSVSGANLVLDNGTPLGFSRTFIPDGYRGTTDGGAALIANAGRYNLELPDDLTGARQSLVSHPEVNSASLNLRHRFGERVETFVDVSWSGNRGRTAYASFLANSVTLQAGAANNPFDAPVVVSFPVTGLDYPAVSESDSLRATGGVVVRLPRAWSLGVDYVWNRSRVSSSSTVVAFRSTVNAALGNGSLDVMRDLNLLPLDFSPYLLLSPDSRFGPADTVLTDATMRLSGPVYRLPGGPLTLSGLLEHREEEARANFSRTLDAGNVETTRWFPERRQEVDSLYLEARAPLISASNGIAHVHSLELQGSARSDRYETSAPRPGSSIVPPYPALVYNTNRIEATDYTLGLSYAPAASLMLRGSYGTGFLPPAFNQIVPNAPTTVSVASAATLLDPKRGGTPGSVGSYQSTQGGNPDLLPEESTSWSLGAVFTPAVLPGLRISLDYTVIRKADEIRTTNAPQMLELEAFFPDRITRDPLSTADAALGYTGGRITVINSTQINVAGTRLAAYDLQVDYDLDTRRWGDFRWYAVITRQPYLERQSVANSAFVDSVGFSVGQLEWRGNAGLTWARGLWSLGWNMQYFDSYLVYSSLVSPAIRDGLILSQGSPELPSQSYHDVFASYTFEGAGGMAAGFLDGMEVTFGVQNLFNQAPPILATSISPTGYSTYGDAALRRYSISLRRSFGQ